MFEKIIRNQITGYFDCKNLFTKYQSGFRKGYSTMTSLLSVTNEWLCNIDEGLINGVLFLDIKKASDTINHKILLAKLKYYCSMCTLLKVTINLNHHFPIWRL